VSSTRERILDNALELIRGQPDVVPSMSALARATGISRQALYLHFPDRATLLLALVEHADEREDLPGAVAAVMGAPDGPAQVRAWAEMQAARNPRIAAVARAFDQSRHADDPAATAWRDRTTNRMRAATAVVERLRSEGHLHRNWTTEEAAAVVWELTSFRVWDDLVNEAGLAPGRYVEIVTAAALSALAAPLPKTRRRVSGRSSPGP
jgi:AcrR family transcriptional regulator